MRGVKQYERQDLLDRAIEVFRRHGYCGSKTAQLVAELDVNRKSLYAEFGSKQGLFEAALERYMDVHFTGMLAPLEAPGADVRSIRLAFERYASSIDGRYRGLGCLMANTAVERASLDPATSTFVDGYLRRVTEAFRRALTNSAGTRPDGARWDVEQLASFLTLSLVGVSVLVRASASPDLVHAAVAVAMGVLDDPRGGAAVTTALGQRDLL